MGRHMALWLLAAIALLCLGSARGLRGKCDDDRPTRTGPCADYKPMWFFHQGLNECIMFYWGGCDQTENRFDSSQECESLCLGLGEVTATESV